MVDALKQEAENGCRDAQFQLAWQYANGDGVPQDDETAAILYGASASQGHPVAMFNLAECFVEGKGVARNEHEAIRLMRQANEKIKQLLEQMKDTLECLSQDV